MPILHRPALRDPVLAAQLAGLWVSNGLGFAQLLQDEWE